MTLSAGISDCATGAPAFGAPLTAFLDHALAEAVRHRICTRNAAADQGPPPKGKPTEVAMLNAEQVAALLAKLDGDDQLRVPVITALFCGLRNIRAVGLAVEPGRPGRRQDARVVEALDEADGKVTVKVPKTKAGRRSITLPQIVVDALRAHKVRQLEIALIGSALGARQTLGQPPGMAGRL